MCSQEHLLYWNRGKKKDKKSKDFALADQSPYEEEKILRLVANLDVDKILNNPLNVEALKGLSEIDPQEVSKIFNQFYPKEEDFKNLLNDVFFDKVFLPISDLLNPNLKNELKSLFSKLELELDDHPTKEDRDIFTEVAWRRLGKFVKEAAKSSVKISNSALSPDSQPNTCVAAMEQNQLAPKTRELF